MVPRRFTYLPFKSACCKIKLEHGERPLYLHTASIHPGTSIVRGAVFGGSQCRADDVVSDRSSRTDQTPWEGAPHGSCW